jgi:protein TonB
MTTSTAFRPSLKSLLLVLGAFALGLLLFFFLWMGQRDTRVSTAPVAPTSQGPGFEPLPAPMPGGATGASGMEEPDERALAERPRVIEAPRPAPAPARPAPPTAAAAGPSSQPVLVSSPAPRYPQRALRRNETGIVRVAVDVGMDGVPMDVRLESSSQSRDLDRAAVDAVRKWRFRPAQRNGQPMPATIVVPIEFKL